ncbi:unnamed protein product [Sphagnum troendelagicum]|uniref:Ribosomal protein S14 n=1 Tax=Sphagnum troendelagicum TaxID=128251 RepID=A0ABP0UCU2_9BRYO
MELRRGSERLIGILLKRLGTGERDEFLMANKLRASVCPRGVQRTFGQRLKRKTSRNNRHRCEHSLSSTCVHYCSVIATL